MSIIINVHSSSFGRLSPRGMPSFCFSSRLLNAGNDFHLGCFFAVGAAGWYRYVIFPMSFSAAGPAASLSSPRKLRRDLGSNAAIDWLMGSGKASGDGSSRLLLCSSNAQGITPIK